MPTSEPGVEIALVTAPDDETAARIARALVEEGLAACVNLLPGIRSIYRWEGEVEDTPEVLLVVKSRTECAARLEQRVRALHPYEVPELLRIAPTGGSEAYLLLVRGSCTP